MRVSQRLFAGALFLLAACCVTIAVTKPSPATAPVTRATSVVQVNINGGHGSGVHLGNGFVLTAAHVTENDPTGTVTDTTGLKLKYEVLWVNKTYDLSLIRVEFGGNWLGTSSLTCRHASVGEPVEIVGNPLDLGNIHTWGRVSGPDIPGIGDWKVVFTADALSGPGNSGGPVFDANHEVIGILVGGPNREPLSLIVPSHVACTLMGRSTQ